VYRDRLAAAAALIALSGSLCAQAQPSYPTKPIRMIVGFTPGSEIDVIGRLVAPELSDRLGQRVVLDNRSGAGGTVAGAIAATASPDGYTLFLNSVAHAASAALYPKLPYNAETAFAPVSLICELPFVLMASPKFPPNSVKELIEVAFAHVGLEWEKYVWQDPALIRPANQRWKAFNRGDGPGARRRPRPARTDAFRRPGRIACGS